MASSRVVVGALLVLIALANGCAHRPTTAGQGTSADVACYRARGEGDLNAVQAAGVAWDGARDRMVAEVLYDMADVDYRAAASLRSQARGLQSRVQWGSGFLVRESSWAEQCRLAREREREAELQHQQTILTPP